MPLSSVLVNPPDILFEISCGSVSTVYLPTTPIFDFVEVRLGSSNVKKRKTKTPKIVPKKIIALNLLKKAWISLIKYRSDMFLVRYTNSDKADIKRNNAVTTNVSLKTNFSTPLLVNEDEFELRENPVPLT